MRTSRYLRLAVLTLAALLAPPSSDASAFTHVVSKGETLAQIAIRFYGTARFETALVGANALDAHGGSAIVPGQPLEIPAPSHHRVEQNETWAELARVHLGDARRAETLARANGGVSWIQPATAQEIEVPAVVAIIAAEGETVPQLAQRYLGDVNKGWEIDGYNGRKGDQKLLRGDVILIPLLDVALTEEGKKAARVAAERIRTEGSGRAYEAQRRAEADIPPLLADVRAGRFVDAVARGNRLLGSGDLTKPQLATIHRALIDAYVAVEAHGLAAGACAAWRANAGDAAHLDPKLVSPKVRLACGAR
ncbi:MAG TPA: LysM domain-containing protein [Labilithrix sp.]|nr:LysM domain-containing protein [Labilithrix sp.]